jgi:hypothetical protein
MESAFSETRRAAELLQQFGGFPFTVTVIVVSPPFVKISLATHHTPSCPVICPDLHSVVITLVRSPVMLRDSVLAVLPR